MARGWVSKLITYTLTTESGSSLRGAGWKVVAELKPMKEGDNWRKNKESQVREWQPIYGQQKLHWEITRPTPYTPDSTRRLAGTRKPEATLG